MSGFYDDDKEEKNEYKRMVVLCVAASSIVLLLFLMVLYINSSDKRKRQEAIAAQENAAMEENAARILEEQNELNIGKRNLVSSDLDFWNMYDESKSRKKKEDVSVAGDDVTQKINEFKEPTETVESVPEVNDDTDESAPDTDDASDVSDIETLEVVGSDDNRLNDGKHIAIMGDNGKKMWYEISDKPAANKYDLDKYLTKDGQKLSYTSDKVNSSFGIDVSKYQGDIDWTKVKEAGVDFAMLRVAARGYESGALNIDDKFVANITGATTNGLKVGVYVFSQAINEIEAVEEANFAVAGVMNYNIAYPIAIDIEEVSDTVTRIDKLDVATRTKNVKAFCDTVKNYGFKPVIYASRDYLIKMLDMDALAEYDIWLRDTEGRSDVITDMESTDFPYRFTMWQYNDKGTINGITGAVDLNISFSDNTDR